MTKPKESELSNEINRRKVIVLLIDGFREDFLEWGCPNTPDKV
jgi:hypothetical protein